MTVDVTVVVVDGDEREGGLCEEGGRREEVGWGGTGREAEREGAVEVMVYDGGDIDGGEGGGEEVGREEDEEEREGRWKVVGTEADVVGRGMEGEERGKDGGRGEE